MTFVTRAIDVVITLGTGDFGEGQGNTSTLSGYWVKCDITKGGAPSFDKAECRIFGPSKSLMNQLTRLGKPIAYERVNTVTINAGDQGSGMSQVFTGLIQTIYGDFSDPPNASLVISAFGSTNTLNAAKPAAATSFPQPTPVSTIVNQIAGLMGLGFINDGVDVTLSGAGGGGPYYAGTPMQQLQKCAEHGNFNYITNGGTAQQSVEIWPKGQSRGAQGPDIGPGNGLVGYPKFSDAGAEITALFQPGMGLGTAFNLQTSITSAVGTWYVYHLEYDLEAHNPGGENPWFMHIDAQRSTLAS